MNATPFNAEHAKHAETVDALGLTILRVFVSS